MQAAASLRLSLADAGRGDENKGKTPQVPATAERRNTKTAVYV